MSDPVAEFVKSPLEEVLDRCTKEQLLKLAVHYEIEISNKRLKDTEEHFEGKSE